MLWLADPVGDEPVFTVETVLLKPDSRGTVRLASADPEARPRITLPHLEAARDVERLAEGYRLAAELLGRSEVRRLAPARSPSSPPPEERNDLIRGTAYSVPHVVGTCRMGPAPAAGDVVDTLGRVHGIDRLSVIDASIIPEPPSGFPHVITIMVAEHLAETVPALL
jgi:choline dehydrogenase